MTYTGLAEKERWEYRDELADLLRTMSDKDQGIVATYTDHLWSDERDCPAFMPDFVIAPDGKPYLYRWYLFGNPHFHPEMKELPGMNLHIQVASDPERPLHDHPWDNVSHILSGGYEEIIDPSPANQTVRGRKRVFREDVGGVWHRTETSVSEFRAVRKVGDVIHRAQQTAHRLILPEGVPYTITIFTYGPKVAEWGFWYPDGWHSNRDHVAIRDGVSVHVNKGA